MTDDSQIIPNGNVIAFPVTGKRTKPAVTQATQTEAEEISAFVEAMTIRCDRSVKSLNQIVEEGMEAELAALWAG